MIKNSYFGTLRCLLSILVLIGCLPHLLMAQAGRGSINGLISDPSGAVIPNASVTLLNHATGITQTTVTTAAGLYSFISLSPGDYEVKATANGFQGVVREHVSVIVDQTIEVNISLRVGSASEIVTVNETTDLAETSNSTVGQLISADTIDRVPLLTRNVYDLVQLSAGVTPANGAPNSSSSFAITNISSGRPGVDVSSYTINGAIVGSVYYMVDGSPVGIAENNAAAIIPALDIPEDAVDEVRVETQNTPASYLSGGAGVISLVSKSGTDAFHGDAFGVFRPDVLASNEYFNKQSQISQGLANTPPSFHRYQEGGSIGGPIKRGKLFFFGDYEATQQELYDGSNLFTVPTTPERNGDFSADPFTIYDPTQPDNADGTRQAFADNKITNISPIAQKFLSEMPKCNMSNIPGADCDTASDDITNNFFAPGLDPTTAQRFDARIDWNQSEKQRIFGRFSFDRLFNSTYNAFGNMWDLNYAQNVTNGRNILVADDLTLSPTTVLQLRYSFTRHYENQGGDPRQVGFDITSIGFPSYLAAQEVYKLLPFVLFNDSGSGVGGTADYNTFQYASENSDANATITKIFGKHEISAGFEWMKRFLNVGQPPAASGAYGFDISATDQATGAQNLVGGSDFASFLLGMGTTPGSESDGYPSFTKDIFAAEESPYYAAFIEDTYHPTKKITITAGLRWDIFGGRTERHNRLEFLNQTATNTVSGVQYTGAEQYVTSGSPSPYNSNLTNFGPRLGFSWQPSEHFIVRGGAGYYYGPSTQMVASAGLNSDGFASQTTWNATCYNADGNTVYNGTAGCVGAAGGSPVVSNNASGLYAGPYSLSNPFPNGVVQLLSNPTGLGNNLGTTLNTVLHSQRTPTTYNFNFGWEYEFPHQIVLSTAYVGSRGLFIPFGVVDYNQLDLGTIAQYGYSLCVDPSNAACQMVTNTWAPIQPSTNANYGTATVPLWVSLQQFPQFGNGSYGGGNGVNVHGYPGGDSDYSSLQTKLQKKLTSHFTTLASFTWAKLITDNGNPPLGFVGAHLGAAQDWRNLNYEHSISPQDVKYQFTGEVSYDLPVGKQRALPLNGAANEVLGGWTANAIVYLSTGIPIAAPTVGANISYFNQRADMTCDPRQGAPHTAAQWFNFNCFSFPSSPFVAGTAPAYIDSLRTMGAQDVDISLYKKFELGEKREIRIDVSSYNIFNRAQLGIPNTPSLTVPDNIGLVQTTVNTPRQFQFGGRFTF
ncbi:carboxypeptidase regulatory-like domain-containing protein [Acidicapsa dinghuensis]|uniref:Carboxypeptidase regulatory-like domain-containing protein n=1 Tax=Acidicapsa dinghuensis TaxID=2218256 RepID=A0ABW1EJP1_9BACT|nr:carboxypeptidase regulatory-like domain-containing protein [Acidicapsa dinghuensis]